MVHIAISAAAFAIIAKLPLGSVAYEAEVTSKGDGRHRFTTSSAWVPAANSNSEKEPDDWVSGDDPMTGAQVSYLKTLSEECGEHDGFQPALTKAEASKRIDAPKAKRRLAQNR
jgi:Protein of unknown function (DUF3072)